MYSILLAVVGGVVGALARYIGPGGTPSPMLGSVFFGMAGAVVGQYVGRVTGFSHGDLPADFVTALVGALLLVVSYRAVALGRAASH